MGLANRVLRGVYRTLIPQRAKNSLRVRLLFDERDKPPVAIEDFADGPVLVLSPHMDDEVIGCGGALRRHALAGARIRVVYLTDGSRGSAEFAERSARELSAEDSGALERARELTATRKDESRRAAEVLGLPSSVGQGSGDLVFLDEPDGELGPSSATIERLVALVEELRPRVVYVPSVLDTHEDHWASNLALNACLRAARLDEQALTVRQYEVWTPLVVNAVVDISAVIEEKRRALESFESQKPQLDVVRMTLALNQYRSIYQSAGSGYAEAFWQSSVDAYRELMARARSTRQATEGRA